MYIPRYGYRLHPENTGEAGNRLVTAPIPAVVPHLPARRKRSARKWLVAIAGLAAHSQREPGNRRTGQRHRVIRGGRKAETW